MTRRAIVALSLAVGLGWAMPEPAAQTPQFRATVTGTGVLVVVRQNGRPVRGLRSADFTLLDAGVPQEVTAVEAVSVPLDVSLVVQETARVQFTQYATFEREMAAVARTLAPADRLQVVLAGDDPRPMIWPVARDLLLATAMHTATCRPMYDALARVLMQPLDPDRQHVVITISEGEGSGSFLSYEPVADLARRSNARVYVVGIEPNIGKTGYLTQVLWAVCSQAELDWSPHRQQQIQTIDRTRDYERRRRELWLAGKQRLVEIAKLTGGGELHPSVLTNSTAGAVRQALDDVRAGYLLYYTPRGVPETGWHPIAVTVNRPGRYDVRTRPGYQR